MGWVGKSGKVEVECGIGVGRTVRGGGVDFCGEGRFCLILTVKGPDRHGANYGRDGAFYGGILPLR